MSSVSKLTGTASSTLPGDDDVVKDFVQGDNKAFKIIFNQFYKPLVYFANRLTNDVDAAEDITAESFCYLYKHRHRYTSMSYIKAFLYMANRNACYSFVKARIRHEASHKEILYLAEKEYVINPLMQAADTRIENYLFKLPPRCAVIFKMYFYDHMKTEEIAAAIGTTGKTVLNQKLKAVKLLREAIKNERSSSH